MASEGFPLKEDVLMWRPIVFSVAVLLAAGCSSGDEEGGSLTREQFASEFPSAYCAWQFRCCDSSDRHYSNEADCVVAEGKSVVLLLKLIPVESFHGNSAYKLINKYKDLACPQINIADQAIFISAAKKNAAGEACTSSLDCDSLNCFGKICAKTGSKDGAPCNPAWDPWYPPCGAGFFCDAASKTCKSKFSDGKTCGASHQCKSSVCAPKAKTCVTISGKRCTAWAWDSSPGTSGVKACYTIMCEADADCDTKTYKGGCDTTKNLCMMCKADADCDSKVYKGGCNTTTNMCAMCKADADCTISTVKIMTGKCDTTTGYCIKCAADADCTYTASTFKKCGSAGYCVMCAADADCATGETCTKGACVKPVAGCKTDADCSPSTLKCDVASGKCTCAADADCGTPTTGIKKYTCK